MNFIKRNSATILTFVGGIGVITTAALSVKATPKAVQLLEQAKKEKGEELTKTEVIKVAWKPYIPAVASGVGTLMCIFGANVLNKRSQAALVSAYAMIDSSYKEYKQKLKELYGEEAHEKIVDAIAAEKAKEVGVRAPSFVDNCVLYTDESCGAPVLFYDEWSKRYFETTIEQVITAEYHLNRNFILRGFTVLNEFYDFLGIEPTKYGSELGWTVEDEIYWVEFNHRKVTLDDGLEVIIIETPWGPSTDWKTHHYYW